VADPQHVAAASPEYWVLAVQRLWRDEPMRLDGTGRYAVVRRCRGLEITLCETRSEADRRQRQPCGRSCRRHRGRHMVVDLGPRQADRACPTCHEPIRPDQPVVTFFAGPIHFRCLPPGALPLAVVDVLGELTGFLATAPAVV
jgi:hypothetical protein